MSKLILSGSVGIKGNNRSMDIKNVQVALNSLISLIPGTMKLKVDGSLGLRPDMSKTVAVIKQFQKKVVGLIRPDGKIDQNKRTHRTINAKLSKTSTTTHIPVSLRHDMLYDGQELNWVGVSTFKATSGMPSFQNPSHQCEPDKGPVPEGTYYIPLIEGGMAKDDGSGVCQLKPSWQIETIPRGAAAGACEPYWANWGDNRVRFEPADMATKNKCPVARSGFYLHDSTKGFSHGCIEIEGHFFSLLRTYLKRKNKKKRLIIKIEYIPGRSTNGGTKTP